MIRYCVISVFLYSIFGCTSSSKLVPNEIKHQDSISEYTNSKQSLFPSKMQNEIDSKIVSSFSSHFNASFKNRDSLSKSIHEVLRDKDGRIMRFTERWDYKFKKINAQWTDDFVFYIYGYPSAETKEVDLNVNFPYFLSYQSAVCFSFDKQKYFVTSIPKITKPPRDKFDYIPEYYYQSRCF